MIAYMRCRQIFAVYAEISAQLGLKPFFKIERQRGEMILHIPYVEIIFTPSSVLKTEYTKEKRNL